MARYLLFPFPLALFPPAGLDVAAAAAGVISIVLPCVAPTPTLPCFFFEAPPPRLLLAPPRFNLLLREDLLLAALGLYDARCLSGSQRSGSSVKGLPSVAPFGSACRGFVRFATGRLLEVIGRDTRDDDVGAGITGGSCSTWSRS